MVSQRYLVDFDFYRFLIYRNVKKICVMIATKVFIAKVMTKVT